ncbi:hypothetical protein BaRGS_00023531 [Batillaria attramentaria]|uniref:Uncharacterized protein n=1 Tax=Batillaria attramentaria TaxID=370345 RepID=A0ABD0KDT7_9CAEN
MKAFVRIREYISLFEGKAPVAFLVSSAGLAAQCKGENSPYQACVPGGPDGVESVVSRTLETVLVYYYCSDGLRGS